MKQVKKYFSMALFVLFSIGFIWLILDYNGISIHKKIDHTIAAGIYANGIQVGETYVTVSGKTYPRLLEEDKFFGKFAVLEMPETQAEEVDAEIIWYEEKVDGYVYRYQLITYHYYAHGTFRIIETPGAYMIKINRSMDEFVWELDSDHVLSSSAELYHQYLDEKSE